MKKSTSQPESLTMRESKTLSNPKTLLKARTDIRGLDGISEGGLPAGRPTLICGGAGCGKTLLSIEFLVRGATGIQGRVSLLPSRKQARS
jgi:archaellum biogenesis ATPase FlaH